MGKNLYLILAAIVVVVLVGVGAYFALHKSNKSSSGTGNAITIQNMSFSPATLTVPVGTTVTWTNKDSITHIVTSDTDVFVSSGLSKDGTFQYTFNTAGEFPYHCSIHPYMTGKVVVQ